MIRIIAFIQNKPTQFKYALILGAIVLIAGLSGGHVHAQSAPDPQATPTATAPVCQAHSFFGLQPWYQYLQLDPSTCDVKNFNLLPGGGRQSDLLLIMLAVIDDLLRIAGLAAVGFIIYASINFITSQGNPEDTARARSTAINALIGLVIATVAVVFVSFIGNKLGG